MSSRRLICLLLLLLSLLVSAEEISPTAQWAQDVAIELGKQNPAMIGSRVHWYLAVDASGSMSGKSLLVKNMLEAFLRHTVVEGDAVTRLRFDSRLHDEVYREVGNGTTHLDPLTKDLNFESGGQSSVGGLAREKCEAFVKGTGGTRQRVALLISDFGDPDGQAAMSQGSTAEADFKWTGEIETVHGKKVPLVVLIWVGEGNAAQPLPDGVVRKLPSTKEVLAQRASDPDEWKRKLLQSIPLVALGLILCLLATVAFVRDFARLSVKGQSGKLGISPLTGNKTLPVDSGGSKFFLNRRPGSEILDGTRVLSVELSPAIPALVSPGIKLTGLEDSLSGGQFEVDVNGRGFGYSVQLPEPGTFKVSVRSSSGLVVDEETVELSDTRLRFLLIALVGVFVLGFAFYLFKGTLEQQLTPPRQAKYDIVQRTLEEGVR